MKRLIINTLLIIFISCAPYNQGKNYYITRNSISIQIINDNVSSLNEITIKPKNNASDLQHFFLNKYGSYSNKITVNRELPMLVWTNVKIDSLNETYTVGVSGEDKIVDLVEVNKEKQQIRKLYCSAIVIDSNGNDCLKEDYINRPSIVSYLINAVDSTKKY